MRRLIDANKFTKQIAGTALVNNYPATKALALCKLIDSQPIAYDVDKVVEQLENERKFWENAHDRDLGKEKTRSYEHAIEIVKGGGVDER